MIDRLIIALTMFATGYMAALPAARAHEWYPKACCHDRDCSPAKVHVNQDGTITARTKHGIARFTADKFRPSQDAQFHACINPITKRPICLFLPGGV